MSFPADHGPHPDYRTEWWYFTGNLQSQGSRFGYQLTFFRSAAELPEPAANSAWSASQVYLAHLAISDIDGGQFHSRERTSRASLGLAGANETKVWCGPWSCLRDPRGFHLQADGLELDLLAVEPTLQGDRGFSRKAAETGVASYYYSLTRLPTRGHLTVDGEVFEVSGNSWMDHEWSSHTLADHLEGWDWFSLQMEDGTDIMAFRLRRQDGTWDDFNAGTFAGEPLRAKDFSLRATGSWTSPSSGVEYPAGWELAIPSKGKLYRIEPALANQELQVSVRYWEGAVKIKEAHSGVEGVGYVELVGYAARDWRARRDSNPQPSGP
ncbi:MAG: lipocalin-like domain-containing protein [Vulcanimicrobiota bacterium]